MDAFPAVWLWQGTRRRAFIAALAVASLFGSSCARKNGFEPESREITQAMIAAAESAAPNVKTRLSSSPLATVPEERSQASVDVIIIRLNDPAARAPVEQALDNVARTYRMVRTPESTSGDTVRWDYTIRGVPRQSIRLDISGRPSPPSSAVLAPARPMKPLPRTAPRLAVIIDDLGYDRHADDAALSLPGPLTVSVLPNLPLSVPIATEAHARGYQVILHLPMQPENDAVGHEQVQLHPGMSPDQIKLAVSGMLATVPYAVGVNNHEGSRATADPQLMQELMPVLKEKNLFFVDSRTTAETVAYQVAQRDGVSSAYRKVFLDDVPDRAAILAQIQLAVRDATRDGWAIAIGHPRPATILALREELPRMQSEGIQLVFASDLTR